MTPDIDETALRDLIASHDRQLGLCQNLERIADALPRDLGPTLTRETAWLVYGVMVKFGEADRGHASIADVTAAATVKFDFTAMIERLLRENEEDLDCAEELQEALRELGAGRRSVSADALGYMLRSVFGARKRRIALEAEILQALVPRAPN
jgi:hypothetical protein